MANFAVIDENNLVLNVIIAETLADAESVTGKTCIEYTDENPGAIGWTYDGINFIAPVLIETAVEETPEDPA